MDSLNDDFSITFWIKLKENPLWTKKNSEINFPPITVENGIQVYFLKINNFLKVFILHPNFGYQKLATNIKRYRQTNVFIVLTAINGEVCLYLNNEKVSQVKNKDKKTLEIGDYVMAKVGYKDLEKNKISRDLKAILPAKIKKIKRKKVILDFFNIDETTQLPKSRLHLY